MKKPAKVNKTIKLREKQSTENIYCVLNNFSALFAEAAGELNKFDSFQNCI